MLHGIIDLAVPDLSIVVGYYNMRRELPRTLQTLSRHYQVDVSGLRHEIYIVDNGSSEEPRSVFGASDNVMAQEIGCTVHWRRHDGLGPSPVRALNQAMRESKGKLMGLMIDGARMLSPGVFRSALRAAAISPRAVIATHGFHLGPDLQSRSVLNGYDQQREDEMLEKSDWEDDGYRLFDISVFAGSSYRGWFVNPTESNCLIMPRALWEELGYLEERFQTPGGGLANLDIYKRACELPDVQRFLLLGEGTFHQYHGGAATGRSAKVANPNAAFDREYEQIRGEVYRVPTYPCTQIGEIHPSARRHLLHSATLLAQA